MNSLMHASENGFGRAVLLLVVVCGPVPVREPSAAVRSSYQERTEKCIYSFPFATINTNLKEECVNFWQ